MKLLTREELARGRRLVEDAFDGPWRYTQFRIDCACAEGLTDDEECQNPECDGDSVPATFVEAPEAYPADAKRPQVVATIEVPGLSDLAEKNGEAICWLRNNAEALIAARDQLNELTAALAWCSQSTFQVRIPTDTTLTVEGVLAYAKSLGWNP